jgi:hypothetical protein
MPVTRPDDQFADVEPSLDDLPQMLRNLALTPSERIAQLVQMHEFYMMCLRAERLGPPCVGDDAEPR